MSQILMEHRDSKTQRIRLATDDTDGTLYSSAAQAIKQIPKDVLYGFLRFSKRTKITSGYGSNAGLTT